MSHNVVLYSDYQSPYGGNLIPSLIALEEYIIGGGGGCTMVFPEAAQERSWCRELMANGHEVALRPVGNSLDTARWLKRLVEERNVNIIHVHLASLTAPALLSWAIPSLRVVQQVHSDWSLGRGENLATLLKGIPKKILTSRVARIAVSRDLGEKLNCPYVENGIDLSRVHGLDAAERGEMRRHFGIGEGSTLITVFAWSPEVKGLDIACGAVKKLREQGLDFELGIVGAEDLNQTRQWVDAKTSVSSSAPWIHFLPPIVDVFEYHGIADIVLSASRSEGFSYVLCEAVLACKPCVASDISGTKWSHAFDTVDFFESENMTACATALAAIDRRRCAKGFKDALLRSSKECAIRYNTRRWAEEVYSFYDGDAR